MMPRWDYGDSVRVIRNVKNDGTFPGMAVGEPLVRRGSVGYVVNIGTFLQDQIIYSVNFIDQGRIVGCREEELIGEEEPWVPSRFEFREKVCTTLTLSVGGEPLVPKGSLGEVIKVLRNETDEVIYHIHFDCLRGRVLMIPERMLEAAPETPAVPSETVPEEVSSHE